MVRWLKAKSQVAQLGLVITIFTMIQVLVGVLMVVQYARLQNFQNCQAAFNNATSNVRDVRVQAQMRDQNATANVLAAVKNKDKAQIDAAINTAVAAHQAYVEVQKKYPYKSPQSFCGRGNPP